MRIRPAARAELARLQEIERAAGVPFRDVGMADVADDAPPALETLERYRRAGRCWVAADARTDVPAAYLIAEPVDGALHVEQVSVHPDAARRGVGRALLARAADRAREEGLTALTLTTFTEVPWNAPYYARLGFRTLSEAGLTRGCGGSAPRRRPTVSTGGRASACASNCRTPRDVRHPVRMTVRPARERDFPGFLDLAAQVEEWFGPMVEEPGFHDAVREHIAASRALVAPSSGPDLLGGLLFGERRRRTTCTGSSSPAGPAARASAAR